MKLEGCIWRDRKTGFWVVSVPLLDISTQGRTQTGAITLIEDAIQLEAEKKGLRIHAEMGKEEGSIHVSANKPDLLIAFLLRRQRTCHGLSVRDVALRMDSKSPTAYAQYEQGKRSPTLGKLQELLRAIDPSLEPILKAS